MFGYVTPLKPELKIREYEMFRGYYCGVCMHIKDTFGNLPRLTLNYDMAFLGLLLDALHNETPKIDFKRCMAHPLKKKPMIIDNKALEYTAAMNVSLVYYKLIDDVNDDKSIKSKLESTALSPYKRKFNRNVTKWKAKFLFFSKKIINLGCIRVTLPRRFGSERRSCRTASGR